MVVKGVCGVRSKPANPAPVACADGGGPLPGGGSLRARDSSMREEAMKRQKADLGLVLSSELDYSDIF